MKNPIKIIIILIVILFLGILVYRSPDEAYWLEENPKDAIKLGRDYAYYLLKSRKQELLELSIDPAKTRIENSNFRETTTIHIGNLLEKMIDIHEQKIKRNIYAEITAPLFSKQKDEDMELITLEKLESFIVMTFAFKSWDKIVEIPDKGKMLFSVGVRYINPIDNRIALKLVRKIVNLPLLRNFTGRIGTTGRWVVFDYNYKYNLNDYIDWVSKEGENYALRQLKEAEEFRRQIDLKKIRESADRSLKFFYEWGSFTVEEQIEWVESLYKAQGEVEKSVELKTAE